MKQAKLFDGTTLEFPDETADDVMDKVVKQETQSRSSQTDKPEKELSWSDVPGQAIKNIPKSGAEFAGNIYQAVRHPIDTAGNLMDVAAGGLQNALPKAFVDFVNKRDPNAASAIEAQDKATALGSFFKDRYGSEDGFKKTIANDPVGLLSDISAVATGGGSLAAKLPGLAGKTGKAVSTVGSAIDPLTIAAKAIKPVLSSTGRGVANVVGGIGTHTGAEPIKEAARANFAGGKSADDFNAAMRGAPAADVVTDAKIGLDKVRQARSDSYKTGMKGVKTDTTVLDFKPIDQALTDIAGVGSFKGKSISKSTTDVMGKITDVIGDWKGSNPNEFHTPEGMDALKRAIGDIRDSTDFGTPSRLVADKVYNAVKGQIVKQAPEYAKTMSGYEDASKLIKEIEKSLSLGEKASTDTSLRKLQSVMRNNVNTNYGRRIDLVDELESVGGVNLRPQLAGQALSSWTPRGLGNVVAGGTGVTALATGNPLLLPLMAAQSPRLVGEITAALAKGAGKTSRANESVKKLLESIGMSERGITQGAFQAGRASEESDTQRLQKALKR